MYELAGDAPFTMSEYAAELSRQAGKPIAYVDLPRAEHLKVLTGAGLPAVHAELLVDSDVHAAEGDLDDASGDLRSSPSWRGRPRGEGCEPSEADRARWLAIGKRGPLEVLGPLIAACKRMPSEP